MEKPVFTPAKGSGAKFDINKFRREYRDQKAEITRLICEEGDIHAAFKLAGQEVEDAIRRSIRIAEEEAEEGASGGRGSGMTIDFDEIIKSADRMTQSQMYALIVIAGLLKGILSTKLSDDDSLNFLSM